MCALLQLRRLLQAARAGLAPFLSTLLALLLTLFGGNDARAGAPTVDAVTAAQIQAADQALFDILFGSCDWPQLRPMLGRDLEFYHDVHGRIAQSGRAFLQQIREKCRREAEGTDYRARRELDPNSVRLHPIPGYGVLHSGTHLFYRRHADGSETLVERAEFSNLWRRVGKRWQLARVFSFGHDKLTPP